MASNNVSDERLGVSSVVIDEQKRRHASLAFVERLHCVERLLADEPDAAALVLDGALWALVRFACERAGRAAPDAEAVFESLAELAPPVCWRLRLALRAPNPHARLVHVWALMDAISAMPAPVMILEECQLAGWPAERSERSA